MARTLLGFFVLSILCFAVTALQAQTPTKSAQQAPAANPTNQNSPPPDMVCSGEGPKWSIEFVSWGARYLGINQPDRDFVGGFVWVPDHEAWTWQQKNEFGMPPSGHALSATIREASCIDPMRKKAFAYSALVTLPEGAIVSGCCRKLKPGEAALVAPDEGPSENNPPK